ncbi:MAG: uncharacterized protein QOG09_1312 [Solirubrobacterales bacterium]|jgi:uncharacterized membrane protein YfcA|nr:uncharacterized protein [Solirubrobacterales bacterium]
MDPAIVVFGLGIGLLVGMTGMGGGSLMTPALILIFGIKPVTAIGTDIFYSAVTKTAGAWRHLRLGTVNLSLAAWMALGSVPAAVLGVWVIDILKRSYGDDLDAVVQGVLGATLVVVGVATLIRALFLTRLIQERDSFAIERRHKIAAIGIGVTTGFVIGITSAGSGTLIAIMLIAGFRLAPRKVVGTDIFHAAILLWAAGLAHWVGGNVDFSLAANILVGSVPGILIGSQLSTKAPLGFLRGALGVVLLLSGVALAVKGDHAVIPFVFGVAGVAFAVLMGLQITRSEGASDSEPDERQGNPAAQEGGPTA